MDNKAKLKSIIRQIIKEEYPKSVNPVKWTTTTTQGNAYTNNSKEEVEQKLKELGIKNYKINNDLSVDVMDVVDLSKRNLKEIPVQFNKVTGDFYCYHNKLTSLKGAPKEVGGHFSCNKNNLTSLQYAPIKVGKYFNCSFNNLTSVKGAPKEVGGDFNCYDNKIKFTEEDVIKVSNVKGRIYV